MTTRRTTITTVSTVAITLLTIGATYAADSSAAGPPVLCGGLPATIVDSNAGHTVTGTAGADIIAARGGDDVVRALGGNDRVCLGQGRDIVKGGAGNDEFHAEPTLDGRDDYFGDSGADAVRYIGRGVGVSVSLDGIANDGQAGEQDNVRFSTENIQGTALDDELVGNDVRNVFIGSSGDDDLRGGLDRDKLFGLGGDDLLIGNDGSDDLSGGDDRDTILAAALPDGDDLVFGGDGVDTMSYEGRNAGFGVQVTLDDDFNDGSDGEFDNVRRDVENVVGGSGPDTLDVASFGDGVRNAFDGGFGNDTIRTTDDDDLDTAVGNVGTDLCFTDPGDVRIGCDL